MAVAWSGDRPQNNSNYYYTSIDNVSKQRIPVESDPNGKDLNSPGAKADAGKVRPWLVLSAFSNALEEVSKVGTAGAKKYTENGWVEVEDAENRYMDAFGRHMLALGKGKIYDDGPNGTNCKHLAQMIWNLLAVLELQERNERN